MKMLLKLFCLLIFATLPLQAAGLAVGDWTGTYQFAEEDLLRVKYHVAQSATAADDAAEMFEITMNVADVAIEFSEIMLVDGILSFRMNPGKEVACLLQPREDGTYKGGCRSLVDPDESQTIKVFMRPPALEGMEPLAN